MPQRLDLRDFRAPLAAAATALSLALAGCATDPETRAAATGALAQPHGTYDSLLRVADASRAAGDLHSAVSLYRRANAMRPQEPAPLLGLGQTLLDLRAYSEAVTALEAVLKLRPEDANALRALGNAYISLDRPNLAATQLDSALALAPKDHRIFNSLGVALDMIGDHRAAQERYRKGLVLAPDDLSLRNNLGLSLALSGDFNEAVAVLRPLVVHPKGSIRNRQNLALTYGLAGDTKSAAEIARIDLDEADVQHNLAYYGVLRALADRARRAAVEAAPASDEEMMRQAPDAPVD